ncbi:MAG TPA: hypothetical protein VF187_02345 [Gemmatimonadales bacterium]
MSPVLLTSIASLALWAIFTFVRPIGLGVVHLLLILGVVLWIRWWAMRPAVNGQP